MPVDLAATSDTDLAPAAGRAEKGPRLALGILLLIALLVGVAHALVNYIGPYGFHRDEFLYFAMGRHLSIWGMDFPPMIALIAEGTRRLLGDSIVAVRVVPLLAHALLIVLAGVLAREFGGGRFAQVLAAICVALSPLFMRASNLLHPVVLDQLWWTLALYALARIGRTAEERGDVGSVLAWIALGIAGGLGILTKFSIGFLGVSMLVGLLLAPQRRVLATIYPWQAAVIALVIGSPSIVGQIQLKFPIISQMQALQAGQLEHVSYFEYMFEQILMFGPMMVLPVLGVIRLLTVPAMRGYRAVAWTCLAAWALLLVLHGKAYYVGPIYPTLIAAGAAAVELGTGVIRGHAVGRITGNVLKGLLVILILLYGAVVLPMGLPFLGPTYMAQYAARLGITQATRTNYGGQLALPQDYADMIGWPEEVAAVARHYKELPPEKQKEAIIIGDSYGHAGAIDFYGPKLGLPPAVSANGTYWFFGPGTRPGNVAIVLGDDSASLTRFFRVVRPVGRMNNPWGVPEEQHARIFETEQPIKSIQEVWPSLAGQH